VEAPRRAGRDRGIVGVPASTVHAVLRRCGISRLSQVDRVTGEPVRRYEHTHPGALLHADVKKLGNIPDGGGHRMVGRKQGRRHRAGTNATSRNAYGKKRMGHAYVHTVLDDYSRVAYSEVHDDETAPTAAGVLRRAVLWFAARGVSVERVLTDNGACYRSHLWRQQCQDLDVTHKRTRPYRPQTNGKVERFHRTLTAGWAFRGSTSASQPQKRLPAWLHEYNHHRLHSAIGKTTPISRLTTCLGSTPTVLAHLPGRPTGEGGGRRPPSLATRRSVFAHESSRGGDEEEGDDQSLVALVSDQGACERHKLYGGDDRPERTQIMRRRPLAARSRRYRRSASSASCRARRSGTFLMIRVGACESLLAGGSTQFDIRRSPQPAHLPPALHRRVRADVRTR
jgi:transposase InsO family protein